MIKKNENQKKRPLFNSFYWLIKMKIKEMNIPSSDDEKEEENQHNYTRKKFFLL